MHDNVAGLGRTINQCTINANKLRPTGLPSRFILYGTLRSGEVIR